MAPSSATSFEAFLASLRFSSMLRVRAIRYMYSLSSLVSQSETRLFSLRNDTSSVNAEQVEAIGLPSFRLLARSVAHSSGLVDFRVAILTLS